MFKTKKTKLIEALQENNLNTSILEAKISAFDSIKGYAIASDTFSESVQIIGKKNNKKYSIIISQYYTGYFVVKKVLKIP